MIGDASILLYIYKFTDIGSKVYSRTVTRPSMTE